MQHLRNIYHLGIKELIELWRDKMMLVLIIYSFTLGIYIAALGYPDAVQNASIAVVDEDNSQLSQRLTDAFLAPIFQRPVKTTLAEQDSGMDLGKYTFSFVIPAGFQKDVLSGKEPQLQLNVDATQMTQAFVGAGYIQKIADMEIDRFVNEGAEGFQPAKLIIRDRFNPNLTATWFGGINQMVNSVTMLAIILIGSALIREREHGTLEHLLVMPVTSFEIMCAKIWSMLVVVLVATIISVIFILEQVLGMPIEGSLLLFSVGVAMHLFAITSMGMFLACIAQNMPQMGIFLLLVLLPMTQLSGGMTPQESMPVWVQYLMKLAPTTHFVDFCKQILFRGAGLEVVWKPFLCLFLIGAVLFVIALKKFKKTATL